MKILMYADNLNVKSNGVTYAMVNRAKTLKDNYDVHIVTSTYCTQEQIEVPGVKVKNLFEFRADQATFEHEIVMPEIKYHNEILFPVEDKVDCFRVFSDGLYCQYRQYDGEDISVIDYMNNASKRFRKSFIVNGEITKIVEMDQNNKPVVSRYVKDNKCYLTTTMNGWNDVNGFDHIDGIEIPFNELKLMYLKTYIEENEIDTVFIDARKDVELFLQLKRELNLKLYFFLHSNHYKDYKRRGESDSSLDALKNNIAYFEKVVVSTYQQKNSLDLEWGSSDKTITISNIIDYKNIENRMENRLKFIGIGRYTKNKNFTDMIKAIKIVSEKYPEVSLDLFGYGPEKDNLIKTGEELNVNVNDFTPNVHNLLPGYSGYLCTSKYEGQNLPILEAYDSKTPVFAYNCDFGPSEIINDFDNGILVRSKTAEELAQRLEEYIEKSLNFDFNTSIDERYGLSDYKSKMFNMLEESR